MSTAQPVEYLYQEELYAPRSKVLVILSHDWKDISEENQLLLKKILGSVKLDLAAVQIIAREEFDLDDIKAFSPHQIVTFGSTLRGSPTQYQPFTEDGISVIQADSLKKLDDPKKKSLWIGLKQMFNI
jgi:DNA polymerase III psi subunit